MEKPFEDTIGRRIISARMRRGVRQAELARSIDISANSLVKIEKGETKFPRSDVIQKIAQVLRVRADYLLCLSDEMESELEAAAQLVEA